MAKRELLLNLLLLGGICAMGYLVATIEPPASYGEITDAFERTEKGTARNETSFSGAEASESTYTIAIASAVPSESIYDLVGRTEKWEHFGGRLLFRTIILKPTPTPTPTPKPILPPALDAILANWVLISVHTDRKTGKDIAMFSNKAKNNEIFEVAVGDEPITVDGNNFRPQITLTRIDKENFSAELKSDLHEEPLIKKMF